MSDLIDRQMAIDAFLTELTKRERKNLLHTWSTVEVKYFITDMMEQMPSAQPEQRWIPCSERLPDEYGNYLITTYDGNVDIGTIDPKKKGAWSACDSDGFYWIREVAAWMPLPEPYREE